MSTLHTNVIDSLQHNPVTAGFISVGCLMLSFAIKLFAYFMPIMEIHIPSIIMESAQLLASISAITVGVISFIGFIKKRKEKANGEHK